MASGSGNVTANISPLTSLALALAGTSPDATWFTGLSGAQLQTLAGALTTAVTALNTALSGYGLPANFNPFSSPLLAATAGQTGNDYDRLLEQFQAALAASADPSFDNLLASAVGGTPTLPTPPRTPGVASMEEFFSTFAGSYTLKVTNVASEGASSGAAALFPLNSARAVTIGANGDVTFSAVGRTITYAVSDYTRDFTGTASTQNRVNYRDSNNWLELSIVYDPATGELSLDAAGFLANDEGLATLKGPVFIPAPPEPVATCSSGDDKLVFTNGPADFCGFTRSASANSIANYFQFTSAAGTNGVTYVKFDMNSDDSAVEKVTIENDEYAFGCGDTLPACTGVTVSSVNNHKQFTLNGTELSVISGASQGITVNGLLIHTMTAQPPIEPTGTLASLIGTAHAGTYVLSCPAAGGGSANRTIVINADGSSTVDGNAVVDGSHSGAIGASFNNVNSGGSWTSPSPTYNLFFNANGTLMAGPVHGATGSFMGCSAVSGTRTATMNPVSIISDHAMSTTLTCAQGYSPNAAVTNNPVGSTAFSINSNGAVILGGLQLSSADYNGVNPKWTFSDSATFPIQYLEERKLEVSTDSNSTTTTLKLIVTLNANGSLKQVNYSNMGNLGTCAPAP